MSGQSESMRLIWTSFKTGGQETHSFYRGWWKNKLQINLGAAGSCFAIMSEDGGTVEPIQK